LTKATLTAGANITITNSAGGITIAATGGGGSGTVTSVSGTGTVNGLTLTGTVTTSGSLTLGGTLDLSSPPAIGGTTAAAGSFTTLSASSTVTLSGGTANGVTYLNGSKVLTSGSALVFDGTNLGVGTSSPTDKLQVGAFSGNNVITIGAGTTGNSSLYFGDGTGADRYRGYINYTHTNDTMEFATSGSEGMRLTSTGLGIGTSSPSTKLTIGNGGTGGVASGGLGVFLSRGNTTNFYEAFDGTKSFIAGSDDSQSFAKVGTLSQHTIALVAGNGSGSLYLNTSGNLGLGVTPSAWSTLLGLQVKNAALSGFSNSAYVSANAFYNGSAWTYIATGAANRYQQDSGGHQWYQAASGTAGTAITFTQAMTLTAGGRLGIGQTSPGVPLSVQGQSEAWQIGFNTASGTSGALIGSPAANVLAFGDWSGTERARIDSSGNLLVGATSTSFSEKFNSTQSANQKAGLFFNTNASFTNYVLNLRASRNTTNSSYGFLQCSRDGAADVLFIYDSGNVVNANNSYGAISDAKLKENIADASPKLADLMQVKVRNYNLIGETTKQLGVVAQELETVFPSMVDETSDRDAEGNVLETTTKSVKYSVFVPMLIKALQEQQALITQLQADVATLKGN
jgi:hypothetical protein